MEEVNQTPKKTDAELIRERNGQLIDMNKTKNNIGVTLQSLLDQSSITQKTNDTLMNSITSIILNHNRIIDINDELFTNKLEKQKQDIKAQNNVVDKLNNKKK